MTEKGTTSPIGERSTVKHMTVTGDRGDRAGSADNAAQAGTSQAGTSQAGTSQAGTSQAGGRLATAAPPAAAAAAAEKTSGVTDRSGADRNGADRVTVRMPADGAYLSVLRTATAGLAARLDFTLDEIEDMRIAVDEACAMLLTQAIPGSDLECSFSLGQDEMTVSVSVSCLAPRIPSGDTFAWTVLSALAGSVNAQVGPGDVLTLLLRKSRDSSRSA